MRIIYFIETLLCGGKERRLVELLTYLSNVRHNNDLIVVTKKKDIYYNQFRLLNLPHVVIGHEKKKNHILIAFRFFFLCLKFRPDIIHTWGNSVTTYALPTAVLLRIPIVNSQITDAPEQINKTSLFYYMTKLNFWASSLVVANSNAGLQRYSVNKSKGRVIHNGVRLSRFSSLQEKVHETKARYNIKTPFAVVMVASFLPKKNFPKFIETAKVVNALRDDVTFLAVGDGVQLSTLKQNATLQGIARLIFTGRIDEVEIVVSACDIGVLLTNSEGISNSIIEYMALGKPVIANQAGGTKEVVCHNYNGILIDNEEPSEIANIICKLLDDEDWRKKLGQNAKQTIEDCFNIEKMGIEFEKVYSEILNIKKA